MASIRPSSVIVDIRGSIGDQTYSRNSAGLFVRERVTPTPSNTQPQIDCKAALAACAVAWSGTLTEQQREDWRSYAHQFPRPGKWGQLNNTSGYNYFVRCNVTRRRLEPWLSFPNPPQAQPLHPPLFVVTASATTEIVTLQLPPLNYDPPFRNLSLFAYLGVQVPPGRNYYSGPWLFAAKERFVTSWGANPGELPYPGDLTEGQKISVRVVAQHHGLGQISEPSITSTIVGP